MDNLEFLQTWFQSNCNGDWEHNFGIKIETLDNPGWYIVLDLEETKMEGLIINESKEKSDNDWFNIKVLDKQLIASGDAKKLAFLLARIKVILSRP